MLPQDTNLSLVPLGGANGTAKDDSFAKHSFPPDGLVALSRVAYQQTPLSTSQVRPGVVVFTGAGGNITSIEGSLGCTVVDSGFGPRLAEIERGLAAALARAPRWLINTHWHFDHTDGNAAFAAAGATILAHANCRVRLSRDQSVPSLSWSVCAAPRLANPDIRPSDHAGHRGGAVALVAASPGPYRRRCRGFSAFEQCARHGRSFHQRQLSRDRRIVRRIVARNGRGRRRTLAMIDANTVVVPGHGAAADRTRLLGFRDMLRRIEDRILASVEAQLEAREIVSAQPTAEFDPLWGRGCVTGMHFTRMVLAGMGLN